jgi:predicted permease
MAVLFNIVLPVFLVAGLAALVYRPLGFDLRTFSRGAFYLFTPALICDMLLTSDVDGWEFVQILGVELVVVAILWALGEAVARLLKLDGPTRSGLLLALLLVNSGNYGLPVTLFAFGQAGMARATIYFAISSTISASLGVFLAARGRLTSKEALGRVANSPLIYAAAFGLACNFLKVPVPEMLTKAIHLLGQASVPVYLIVLGIQLSRAFEERGGLEHWPALLFVVVGKLLLSPALTFGFVGWMGMGAPAWQTVVVESAMPTAVMATILAHEFDAAPPFVARAILVTTLLSLLTLTVLLNFMLA